MGYPFYSSSTKLSSSMGLSKPRTTPNQAVQNQKRRHKILEPHLLQQFRTIRAHQAKGEVVCIDYLIRGYCEREACRFVHPKWEGHHLNCCVANLRGIDCHRGKTCHFSHIEDDGRIVVPVEETAYARRNLKSNQSRICAARPPPRLGVFSRAKPLTGQSRPKVSADEAPTWRVASNPPTLKTDETVKTNRMVKKPPGLDKAVETFDWPNMRPKKLFITNGLNPDAKPFQPTSLSPLVEFPMANPKEIEAKKRYSPLFMTNVFYTPSFDKCQTESFSLFSDCAKPPTADVAMQAKPYNLFSSSPHPLWHVHKSLCESYESYTCSPSSACRKESSLGVDPTHLINKIL